MWDSDILQDHRASIVTWIAGASLLFILPFTLTNLWRGRWMVSFAALFVLGVLLCNVIAAQQKRKSKVDMLVLMPAISAFLGICFLKQGLVAVFWCYPAVILFYFLFPPAQARLCNLAVLTLAIPASFSIMPSEMAYRVTATLLGVSVLAGIFIHLISLQQKELERRAVTDPLTQVYNRMQLNHLLLQAQSRQKRYGLTLTVLSLDIDHFKSVNDNYGHQTGDLVLQGVSAVLRGRVRASDVVFRTGGEEFLVLLENTDLENGRKVAEQIRTQVEKSSFLPERSITVSLGVAQLGEQEELTNWLRRVDKNLYQAKEAGRNRVTAL